MLSLTVNFVLLGAAGATMEDLLIFEENYDEDFRFGLVL